MKMHIIKGYHEIQTAWALQYRRAITFCGLDEAFEIEVNDKSLYCQVIPICKTCERLAVRAKTK